MPVLGRVRQAMKLAIAKGEAVRDTTFGHAAPGAERARLMGSRRGFGRYHAIDDPDVIAPNEVDLAEDEWVLVFENEGEVRMYAMGALWPPHVVHDLVGGRRVAVTFCKKCVSGLAFDPVVDGRALRFEAYGLYEGNMAMIDDQTKTIWSQMTGQALFGELAGRRLEILPLMMMPFGEFLRRYPEGTAANLGSVQFHSRGSGPEFRMTDWIRRTVGREDDRIPEAQLILGVNTGESARAYAFVPSGRPFVHADVVADVPLVLIADAGAWPVAFDARVEGSPVTLHSENGSFVDDAGSTWTASGLAIAGPRSGVRLKPVPSRVTRWYAWVASYPSTDVVVLSGNNEHDASERPGASFEHEEAR